VQPCIYDAEATGRTRDVSRAPRAAELLSSAGSSPQYFCFISSAARQATYNERTGELFRTSKSAHQVLDRRSLSAARFEEECIVRLYYVGGQHAPAKNLPGTYVSNQLFGASEVLPVGTRAHHDERQK
jgi:hypothetical protein